MEKRVRTNFKYQPSNGTEGACFMAGFCDRCVRDYAFQQDPENGEGCEIAARSMAYSIGDPEYPKEWMYDERDEPICTAFELYEERDLKLDEDGNIIAPVPRCTGTPDLFG